MVHSSWHYYITNAVHFRWTPSENTCGQKFGQAISEARAFSSASETTGLFSSLASLPASRSALAALSAGVADHIRTNCWSPENVEASNSFGTKWHVPSYLRETI